MQNFYIGVVGVVFLVATIWALVSSEDPVVNVAGNNNTVVAVENGFNCAYSDGISEIWNKQFNNAIPKEEVYVCVRKAR